MIDIHTHIIPGIDDGPKDVPAMLEMARLAVADGISTLVATPHAVWSTLFNDEGVIRDGLALVRRELESAGIPLSVEPGCEVPMHDRVLNRLRDNPAWTIGATGVYVLLEPPWSRLPEDWEDLIEGMLSRGMTPVIAHPERSPDLQRHPEWLATMVDMGCLTQVTANSITGRHGAQARERAAQFLRDGLVHAVASDAHNAENRAPVLGEARQHVTEKYGEKKALELFELNPQKIVEGQPLPVRDFELAPAVVEEPPARTGLFGSLFKRKG